MTGRTGESLGAGPISFLGGTGLLLLAALLGWVLLHAWRPMELPGLEEAELLGEEAPLPREALVPAARERPPFRRSLSRRTSRSGPPPREGGLPLRVRDALTRRPLAGAEVWEFRRPPRLLGRTDGEGAFLLPPSFPLSRLLLRREGYLGTFLGFSSPFFRRLRRRLGRGEGLVGLAPDPVTRPLEGRALPGGTAKAAASVVTLLAKRPADPLRPGREIPPGLAGAWRVALAAESLLEGGPVPAPWELGTWRSRVRTRTDGEGRFRFRVISRGPALLQAEDGRGNTARLAFSLDAPGPLRLRLRRGSWIRPVLEEGRLAPEGTPEDLILRILCRDGWRVESRPGRRAGPFLPGEPLEVEVRLGGLPAGLFPSTAPRAGETRVFPIPWKGGLRLWRARVVEKGSRRPREGVEVRPPGGEGARTGPDGSFALLLPGGTPLRVVLGGGGIQERTLFLPAQGDLPSLVEVLPGRGGEQILAGFLVPLEGVARDASGEPLASARVEALRLDPPPLGALLPRGRLSTATDPAGRFRLLLPAPGRYRLRVFHPKKGFASREVTVSPGGRPEADLVLRPFPEVRGRVLGKDGLPLEGARVVLRREGFPACQARTDREGGFLLRPWGEGRWTLEVFGPGGGRTRRILELPRDAAGRLQVVLGR